MAQIEADKALADLVGMAERDGQVTITRLGQPVAKLVVADPTWDEADAIEAVEHMIRVRKGINLGVLRFKDLTHWDHKY